MITVGIKELKAKLSTYVEQVQNGEEVVITDRGREVALVIPITPERRAVKSLVESGTARWDGGKPKGVAGIRVQEPPLSESILRERR